ncbi:HipA N-terminal domain-containing protein (plasmid) [Rhodobacter capsulatus]|uniref:HipA N-terminal domain-containing protein n=1 Tax=Rhodobacter capsulatus TaxID=1061 RepID=UPI00402A14D6
MSVRVPIWFDALEVGQIEVAADGSLTLHYAARWLQTAGAFPLSVTMPLRAEPYCSEAPGLPICCPKRSNWRA